MRQINFRYKVVNTLILLLFSCGVAGTYLWVYPKSKTQKTIFIISDKPVSGLEVGCQVCYLGVPVGKVVSRSLQDDKVYVKLALHESFTLNQSSYVKLEITDFSIRKMVQIYTPKLQDLPCPESPVLRIERSSDLSSLSEEVFNLVRRVEKVLGEIESILRDTKNEVYGMTGKVLQVADDMRSLMAGLRFMLSGVGHSRFGRLMGIRPVKKLSSTPQGR